MITRNRILFAIGVWTMLVPLLGFPGSFETFFTIVSGLAVAFLAFMYARDKRMAGIRADGVQYDPELEQKRGTTPSIYEEHHPTPIPDQLSEDERFTDLKSIIGRSKNS